MDLTRWIRNFFSFSRSQTYGFLVLLPVVVMVIFSAPLYRWWEGRQPRDFSPEQTLLDSLAATWKKDELNNTPTEELAPVTLYLFDPNLTTAEELLALGFSAGLTKRLLNYRKAGGKFKIKSDLLKLYGMDSSFYKAIRPFVLLPEAHRKNDGSSVATERPIIKQAEIKFDINRADTVLLKSINGIGSKLAKRIVIFRESLGGFIYLNQLYEVYGLDSTTVQRLQQASFVQPDFYPRMLNINEATEAQLGTHPYISKRMAKAIVTYRFQHGRYHSIDDLRKIVNVDDAMLLKLKPYITVD
ncbi:MAG: helix-hairpin-helix domain-containing protein [Cyclobacteriaceae bacterium]|nr:helix-hairpin-helix domain-containing protein [Cyclobacteriaceae bacterium]UYN87511.1 MAG: helix-hairpin-helix domain-containing protein [Cyclobacteriaceae bacterium]